MSVIYDVSNDHFLYEASPESLVKVNWSEYVKVRMNKGLLYIHKKYKEIHYLKAESGLEGQII